MVRLILSLTFLFVSCSKMTSEQEMRNQYFEKGSIVKGEFIAHAGGAINGKVYSNSLEAILKSIQDGKKMIEVDLIETSVCILLEHMIGVCFIQLQIIRISKDQFH